MESKKMINEIIEAGYDSFVLRVNSRGIYIDNSYQDLHIGNLGPWDQVMGKEKALAKFNHNGKTMEAYNGCYRKDNKFTFYSLVEATGKIKVNNLDERYNSNNENQKVPSYSPYITKYGDANTGLIKLIDRIESIEPENENYLKFEKNDFYFGTEIKYPLTEEDYLVEAKKEAHINSYNHYNKGFPEVKTIYQIINPHRINQDVEILKEYVTNINNLVKNKNIDEKITELENQKF